MSYELIGSRSAAISGFGDIIAPADAAALMCKPGTVRKLVRNMTGLHTVATQFICSNGQWGHIDTSGAGSKGVVDRATCGSPAGMPGPFPEPAGLSPLYRSFYPGNAVEANGTPIPFACNMNATAKNVAECNQSGNPVFCAFARYPGKAYLGRGTAQDVALWQAWKPGQVAAGPSGTFPSASPFPIITMATPGGSAVSGRLINTGVRPTMGPGAASTPGVYVQGQSTNPTPTDPTTGQPTIASPPGGDIPVIGTLPPATGGLTTTQMALGALVVLALGGAAYYASKH